MANTAYPVQGSQKLSEINDKKILKVLYDCRNSQKVFRNSLSYKWKGYISRIIGGINKQGFSVMQGVVFATRARLLLKKGYPCYRPRSTGERKGKSVRGCIVDANLSVLNFMIVKEAKLRFLLKRLGPERASRIRKVFLLRKEDDVRHYVVRRHFLRKKVKKQRAKHQKFSA